MPAKSCKHVRTYISFHLLLHDFAEYFATLLRFCDVCRLVPGMNAEWLQYPAHRKPMGQWTPTFQKC